MSAEEDGSPRNPTLQVLDVNLSGTIFSIKVFLHHVQKCNPGVPKDGSPKRHIVITDSEGGFYSFPYDPLVGLTRSLGPAYLQAYGITVNPISPAYMKTAIMAPLIPITPGKYFTPLTTWMKALEELLASIKSGNIVEASGEELYYQPQLAYPNEIARWIWEDAPAVWREGLLKRGAR